MILGQGSVYMGTQGNISDKVVLKRGDSWSGLCLHGYTKGKVSDKVVLKEG